MNDLIALDQFFVQAGLFGVKIFHKSCGRSFGAYQALTGLEAIMQAVIAHECPREGEHG